jgi:hypothetical protein
MNYKAPRTDALRALFEKNECLPKMADVWDLCAELEKEAREANHRAGALIATIRVNTLSNRWKDVTYEEVDAFLKSFSSDEPFDPWQPIETAPRDGTPFLAYSYTWDEPFQFVASFDKCGKLICDLSAVSYANVNYWMPLPEPPKP